jgi:hypothetical protein
MAVCVFQGGPGIEHAYGGIAQAFSDSSPILDWVDDLVFDPCKSKEGDFIC